MMIELNVSSDCVSILYSYGLGHPLGTFISDMSAQTSIAT